MIEAAEFQFDKELLNNIHLSYNDKARSMLNEELARAFNSSGTLLHLAVEYNNIEIVEYLIELGSNVNFHGQQCTTPLILAVENNRLAIIRILLNAGASMELVNNEGISALKMVLNSDYFETEIVTAFLEKLRDRYREKNDLMEKLISNDAAMHHVMLLRDFGLVADILRHSDTWNTKIARNGQLANTVTAVEQREKVAVFIRLMALPIEDDEETCKQPTPSMNVLFSNGFNTRNFTQFIDFNDLIFECYAHTINRGGGLCCFKFVHNQKFQRYSSLVYDLICYLKMMEKNQTPFVQHAFCHISETNTSELQADVQNYHVVCERMLNTIMYENLTLFVLMTGPLDIIRHLVRRQDFERIIRDACAVHHLNERSFAYYYKLLMARIQKANDLITIENACITITISNLFNDNYNGGFHIARRMVRYLNKDELERYRMAFL